MLRFNELRITPDSKHLIIDVEVDNLDYYAGITIENIIIDSQDTYTQNGPSSKPIFTYKTSEEIAKLYTNPDECNCSAIKTEDEEYCFVEYKDTNKQVRLVLTPEDLGIELSNNIFFVYAVATGIPAPDTPCGMDEEKIMGTVVNLYPIYQTSINYMRELNSTCEFPRGLIDLILRIKAIELNIKTGNYIEAIKLWNRFFSTISSTPSYNNCRCYGTSN